MAEKPHSVGQSQWQLIWREFAKRKLAVVSAVVIALLIYASIWAPFLANDRPLFYVGVNRYDYRESLRTCQGALIQLIAHRQKSAKEPPPKSALRALRTHLPLMQSMLPPEDAQRLAEWRAALQKAEAEPDDKAAAAELQELRKTLSTDLSERKVKLVAKSRYPVLASLNWLDILFMTASLTTLLLPLRRFLSRRINPPARKIAVATAWLGVPLLAALLWYELVPAREDLTNYKEGRLASEVKEAGGRVPVVYEAVIWPPVPYGLAESVLERKYALPALKPLSAASRLLGRPPKQPDKAAPVTPWDQPHWFGTDSLGRDALSRMLWGGRVSLAVGVVAVSIYVAIGIIVGALAGYFRGVADLVFSRIIEVVICFPTFFLILTIVAFLGPSIFNIMIIIGLTGWTGVARLVRAEFLRLVDQEFVLSGRALGYSPVRLIFRHILPNALAPVLVSATFGVAGAILTESALSFLGLGITIPIPSWGGIMSDGRKSDNAAPWLILIPGLAIFLTITCYNLVGEALRDASDPRLRGSRS